MKIRKRFWIPLVFVAFIIGMGVMIAYIVQTESSESQSGKDSSSEEAYYTPLKDKLESLVSEYSRIHTYIPNETVCRHMVAEFWNILYTERIPAKIVVGNLEMDYESWWDCNHAWLLVPVPSQPNVYLAVEVTRGEVYDGLDVQAQPHLMQYWQPFQTFNTPSQFRDAYGANW